GKPHEVCIAGILSEDKTDLTVRTVGEILTSQDVLDTQAIANGAICGKGTYPLSLNVPNEWAPVPAGTNLPVVGRVINHKLPEKDLPWDHPFGFDYWYNVAPDIGYIGILN